VVQNAVSKKKNLDPWGKPPPKYFFKKKISNTGSRKGHKS
jgi:hypothetical protein